MADGSLTLPRLQAGDNFEKVNGVIGTLEAELRALKAKDAPSGEDVQKVRNLVEAMQTEQRDLVARVQAREAGATDYGSDRDLTAYVRGKSEGSAKLRSATDNGAPISRSEAEMKLHKGLRLFSEDTDEMGHVPGLLDDPAPRTEWQREVQKSYEEVCVAEMVTGKTATRARNRFARLMKHAPDPIQRIFADSSGIGTEWIPSEIVLPELDRELLLSARGRIEGLFATTPMSTKTVSNPFLSNGLRPYLKGSVSSDDPARFTASSATTTERSRTAVGWAVRAQVEDDATEDSVIDAMPIFRQLVIEALTDGKEDAIINADTAATHQDTIATWDIRGRWGSTGLGTASDHRKAWIGLRARSFDVSGAAATGNSAQTFAGYLAARGSLSAPHGTAGKLVILTSDEYYINKILNFAEVVTLEKYGPGATIVSGEAGKIGGAPVIVTQFLSADLETSGLYTGGGGVTSCYLVVNVDRFKMGVRRGPVVEMQRDATRGVRDIVATARQVFYTIDGSTTKNVINRFNVG